VFAVRFSF